MKTVLCSFPAWNLQAGAFHSSRTHPVNAATCSSQSSAPPECRQVCFSSAWRFTVAGTWLRIMNQKPAIAGNLLKTETTMTNDYVSIEFYKNLRKFGSDKQHKVQSKLLLRTQFASDRYSSLQAALAKQVASSRPPGIGTFYSLYTSWVAVRLPWNMLFYVKRRTRRSRMTNKKSRKENKRNQKKNDSNSSCNNNSEDLKVWKGYKHKIHGALGSAKQTGLVCHDTFGGLPNASLNSDFQWPSLNKRESDWRLPVIESDVGQNAVTLSLLVNRV